MEAFTLCAMSALSSLPKLSALDLATHHCCPQPWTRQGWQNLPRLCFRAEDFGIARWLEGCTFATNDHNAFGEGCSCCKVPRSWHGGEPIPTGWHHRALPM